VAKLHQIIAVEKGAKAERHSKITELYHLLQKADPFMGLHKIYVKKDDEGEEFPSESKKVQHTVKNVITQARESYSDAWQMSARKEWTNCTARANIVVDGVAVVEDVPVTFLLHLEKEMKDLKAFVSALPVLDSGDDWNEDANSGLFKTEAVLASKSKKSQRAIVKYDATEHHPAQTEMITDDILIGYWHTVKHSGALPALVKAAYAKRVEALYRAVKEAREEANGCTEVDTPTVGTSLLNFVFGE